MSFDGVDFQFYSCYIDILPIQLPHSYYFNHTHPSSKKELKGVFFEEFQDLHFLRKRGYFGTHLREFGEKGGNFDVHCFTMKRRVHLG